MRRAGCVFAEDEATLIVADAPSLEAVEQMVERRVAGEPLEYILGWAEFCGLRIAVVPGVFVPRARTELLVSEAIALAGDSPVVVDLCCGSGAIGLAVSGVVPRIELHACDSDPVAVACATRNLASVPGRVYLGDLFGPLPNELRGCVDLLVANVPYVPSDAIALLPREARLFEPRAALDGGADGLDVVRRVAAEAPRWLASGGHLLVETSAEQAEEAAAVLAMNGLAARTTTDAIVVGTR